MISTYNALQYLHIVLFAYWLGGDLGVFLAARRVAQTDLTLDERLRFLQLLLATDMAPRTALVLMVPVGSTLAALAGWLALPRALLAIIWVGSMLWLALTWHLYLQSRRGRALARLTRLDRHVRLAVIGTFMGLAAGQLMGMLPTVPNWLAAKFALYAFVIVLGLLLRGVITAWRLGFQQLRAGAGVDAANDLIHGAHRRAARLALALWIAVAVIAWLGVTKPALG
ncbi:MAG: hypothetical protein R3E77_09655 [Steroidobacteraceae bacterium]